MRQYIIRDVREYFGAQFLSIRAQYGMTHHAFNARTREVRYAFSPTDFDLFDTIHLLETSASLVAFPALSERLEEEDVFRLDNPSEDADSPPMTHCHWWLPASTRRAV